MDSFAKREEGFEAAFSHEETLRFKARALRNAKLGRWLGELKGLSPEAIDAQAAAFAARAVEPHDETLAAEIAAALPDLSPHRLARRFEAFAAEAMAELKAGSQ